MAWTTKASDTFTDVALTNITLHTPDLGSPWLADSGSAHIDSNGTGYAQVSNGFIRNSTTLGNDQAVQAVVGSVSAELFLRYATTGGGQGYGVLAIPGISIRIFKMAAGNATSSQLGSTFGTCVAGDTVRLEAVGTSLTAYRNGTSIITTTDATYASGASGIFSGNWDNFQAQDQSAATGKLRRNSTLNGLGASGPFFHNPLGAPVVRPGAVARRGRIVVPREYVRQVAA